MFTEKMEICVLIFQEVGNLCISFQRIAMQQDPILRPQTFQKQTQQLNSLSTQTFVARFATS